VEPIIRRSELKYYETGADSERILASISPCLDIENYNSCTWYLPQDTFALMLNIEYGKLRQ
jgi:hypothetical protein